MAGNRFDINSFKSEMDNYSVLPSHSFLCSFVPFRMDSTISAAGLGLGEALNPIIYEGMLALRADSINIPGQELLTENTVRRYGYGPIETVAYGMQFNDITISFILDDKASQVRFFRDWMQFIVNYNSQGGARMNREEKGYAPYEVGYKADYSNPQMNVKIFNQATEAVLEYKFYDVFPVSVSNMNFSWAQQSEAQRLMVRFAFTDYSEEKLASLSPEPAKSFLKPPSSTQTVKPTPTINPNIA